MATPLYGFALYESPTNPANEYYPQIGKNSEAFTLGDPVVNDATHGAKVMSGATLAVLGIAAKTVTMASTNETVALVKVPLIPVDQDYTFLAGTNADMATLTTVGLAFQIANSVTGQALVDISSGDKSATSAAVVVCLGVDPRQLGGTGIGSGAREGLFKFIKTVEKSQV